MAVRASLKRFVELLGISARMDLAWLLRDTKYALMGITADVVSALSTLSGVVLIAVRFGGIGGMSVDQVLFMMAYATMVTGLVNLFGTNNNIHISRIIGRGQLEHCFLQPLSLKMQLATCGFSPFTAGFDLLAGAVLMAVAVRRLELRLSVGWVLAAVAYLAATLVTLVARSYLVSTLAFYAPVAAEEISHTAIDGTRIMGTFPLSGMPRFIQLPLVTVLPEGLMAWFPALCLLGEPPLGLTVCYPMLFAILLATATGMVFKKGLRYYVTKGSNRYVSHAFRR